MAGDSFDSIPRSEKFASEAGPVDRGFGGRRRAAGFTLVEGLVVLAVIAILAGALGRATFGGGRGPALEAAQRGFAVLCTAARGQASMHATPVRIVIDNDPESDGYLRKVWIVRDEGPLIEDGEEVRVGGKVVTDWKPTGRPVFFRRGVFLVPPDDGTTPDAMFADYYDPGNRKSNGRTGEMYLDGEWRPVIYYRYNERGWRAEGINIHSRVVIAPARMTPSGPVFENSETVAGMHIRRFGTLTIVNDPTGFD